MKCARHTNLTRRYRVQRIPDRQPTGPGAVMCLELVEYIESTVDAAADELTEAQKDMVRTRAAELDDDPSIGLTWDELDAQIGSRWA